LLLAATVFAVACGGGSSPGKTPSPNGTGVPATATIAAPASPSPTPAATPETLLGVTVKPLKLGEPIPFPKDMALSIESGCWGCDGPAAALVRVSRAPDGQLRTDDLFRLPGATPGKPEVDGRYITSIATANGGDDILLGVCESPYCGGVGQIADGARVSIHHSADGGITWTKEITVDGGAWVRVDYGAGPPGRGGFGLLHRIYRSSPGAAYTNEFAYYPTLETQPIELRGQEPNAAVILVPANGPTLLRGSDGVTFYSLQGGPSNPPQVDLRMLPAGSTVVDVQYPPGGQLLVTWTAADHGIYSAFVDAPGGSAMTFKEVFRWPDGGSPSFHTPQGGFISARTWVITGPGNAPAVVDFDTATIQPIKELLDLAGGPLDPGPGANRMLVKGVSVGPFARVRGAGKGECLQVREGPSLSSPAFACYADGVLLKERGERTGADGHMWALVVTPQQRQGWASTQFLETSGAAPSLAGHARGTRTGNADVDPVIDALEKSAAVSQALIAWRQVKCKAPPIQGLGGPPECPAGVADGTSFDAISGAQCEGYYRLRPADGSDIRFAAGPADRLYAVVRLPAGQAYPPGAAYMLIFVSPDRPEFGKAVYANAGKIVGDWGGCATSPAEMLKRSGTVVFGPPR
jgi:hypothetical protein